MDTMDSLSPLYGILWTLYYCVDTMDTLPSDSNSVGRLQKPGHGTQVNRGMAHRLTGVRRTFFLKGWTREKSWLIQNMACYFPIEQGGSHAPGAINHAKNQRNLAFET